jgi:hypothetical protein
VGQDSARIVHPSSSCLCDMYVWVWMDDVHVDVCVYGCRWIDGSIDASTDGEGEMEEKREGSCMCMCGCGSQLATLSPLPFHPHSHERHEDTHKEEGERHFRPTTQTPTQQTYLPMLIVAASRACSAAPAAAAASMAA